MTDTLDLDDARTDPAPDGASGPASQRAQVWLDRMNEALQANDPDRAAGLFARQSFWRDLIAFTWNIITVEGPEGVRDMLAATLGDTAPARFRLTEPATEDGGVVTAWVELETAKGRGPGLLRLRKEDGDDRACTLLTAMQELAGHEEPRGPRRPMGAQHGSEKERRPVG